MMIAPFVRAGLNLHRLQSRRATKLAGEHDQRRIKQSALLQIRNQFRDRLIDFIGQSRMIGPQTGLFDYTLLQSPAGS